MNCFNFETDYLDLLEHILLKGEDRVDRTGVGTRALFAHTLNIELGHGFGFPLLTTKKMPFKSILSELLWFIEGSSDERRLAEILHGTRDPAKTTIWSGNASAPYWTPKAKFEGDLGRVYGVQWRDWQNTRVKYAADTVKHHNEGNAETHFSATATTTHTDQLAQLINTLKTNPTDRRMILTAWNPGELDQMALPPCHMFAQFYMRNNKTLDCQMYQRSVDSFLGLPFNIASYALLVMLIAQVVGAKPGMLTMVLGDTHIYSNHIDQVKEQLARPQHPLPQVLINPGVMDIDSFSMSDFELVDYVSEGPIKAPMAV